MVIIIQGPEFGTSVPVSLCNENSLDSRMIVFFPVLMQLYLTVSSLLLMLFGFAIRKYILTDMAHKTTIVVGGGLAGLSAAIEAATTNAAMRVILVDKENNIGYE